MPPPSSRRVTCAPAPGLTRAAAVLFLFALLLAARHARATEPLGIALTYEAPRECPTRADLDDALRARVAPSWLSGADARHFDARIVRKDDGDYAGTLAIARAGDIPKVRVIEAKRCREVTTSIAVFLAIALDPSSQEKPPEREEEAPATPADEAPSLGPPPPPTPRRAPPPPPEPPRQPLAIPIWTWSSGVDATYLRMPETAAGARLHAELARGRERSRFALALRLSWGFSRFSTAPLNAGEARFLLKTARPEGCARVDLRPLLQSVSAGACAGIDAGTLQGHTPDLRASVAQSVQWTAATVVLRARWLVLPWLFVGAEASVLVPFERTTFALASPARLVYRAPAALFGSGAGLAVSAHFP